MDTGLNSRTFSVLSYTVMLGTVIAAGYLLLQSRWVAAAVLGGFVALAAIFIAQRDKLPSIFTLLFVLAGLINAAGYLFNLFKTPVWFDETVHFYTSFTIVAAIGWLLFSATSMSAAGHPWRFPAKVTGLGIVLGILWEIFEWIIGIIGSPSDTLTDLLMDTLGAVAAGLFCVWAAHRDRRASASRS